MLAAGDVQPSGKLASEGTSTLGAVLKCVLNIISSAVDWPMVILRLRGDRDARVRRYIDMTGMSRTVSRALSFAYRVLSLIVTIGCMVTLFVREQTVTCG